MPHWRDIVGQRVFVTFIRMTQVSDPMTTVLLEHVNHLQSLSRTLLVSLSQNSQKIPPSCVLGLLQEDAGLAAAITLAHKHQTKQCRVEALKNEVLQLDERWRMICGELETERKELKAMIKEGEERIKAIETAKQGSCLTGRF
jgi:mediator of RNA polymerase II transcription subunit 4